MFDRYEGKEREGRFVARRKENKREARLERNAWPASLVCRPAKKITAFQIFVNRGMYRMCIYGSGSAKRKKNKNKKKKEEEIDTARKTIHHRGKKRDVFRECFSSFHLEARLRWRNS